MDDLQHQIMILPITFVAGKKKQKQKTF